MRNNPSVQHLCCLLTGKISVFSCGAAAEGLLTQTGLPTGWQGLWGIPACVFRKALLQRDPEKAARPHPLQIYEVNLSQRFSCALCCAYLAAICHSSAYEHGSVLNKVSLFDLLKSKFGGREGARI